MNRCEHLKSLRESKGLRQKDMAGALGISERAYAYYEQEESRFPRDHKTLMIIARMLCITIDQLSNPENTRGRLLARSSEELLDSDKASLHSLLSSNFSIIKQARESIDYYRIANLVYENIIKQNIFELPINPFNFKFDNIVFMTMQEFVLQAGITVEQLTLDGKLDDAITYMQDGLGVILYNESILEQRKRFSLFHEIAHIVLGHDKQSDKNEAEANFFAAQCILPNALVREMIRRGYSIDSGMIERTFDVSGQVASFRIDYLKRFSETHKSQHDDVIVLMFKAYLDKIFPNKNLHDIEDDLETEKRRDDWRTKR